MDNKCNAFDLLVKPNISDGMVMSTANRYKYFKENNEACFNCDNFLICNSIDNTGLKCDSYIPCVNKEEDINED